MNPDFPKGILKIRRGASSAARQGYTGYVELPGIIDGQQEFFFAKLCQITYVVSDLLVESS